MPKAMFKLFVTKPPRTRSSTLSRTATRSPPNGLTRAAGAVPISSARTFSVRASSAASARARCLIRLTSWRAAIAALRLVSSVAESAVTASTASGAVITSPKTANTCALGVRLGAVMGAVVGPVVDFCSAVVSEAAAIDEARGAAVISTASISTSEGKRMAASVRITR